MSDLHGLATKGAVPETPDGMLALLGSLSEEELAELLDAQQQLEQRLSETGPQNDDELHEWLKFELGIDVPRVAVCADHQTPFEFLADLYFERIDAALGVANRGGSKTFLIAVLHWLNSRFKPGCESATFGAIEAQSFRAYAHLKNWIYDERGQKKPEIIGSLMRETLFTNGSKIEVLGSTPEAVNGPHPQKAHADEIELMRDDTWRESRNMTVSKTLKDGRVLIPQDILTSTRKGPSGRVQQLIDEIESAVSQGYKPPRKLYMWCLKETAKQMPNCRVARPDLPEAFKCPCQTIRKGEWEDGSPRTLDQVCNGDFHRSRGWQPFGDIVKHFSENDRNTFEVQQLCAKPEMSFHYVPTWRDEKHLIRNFLPDPANGPIFMAVDWGGTNPHAVNWYQLLRHEVNVEGWVQPEDGQKRNMTRLKEGTLVCFDEIYIAEIGNEKLGQMVKEREAYWAARTGKPWSPFERYADPQGKAARMDWKAMGLRTTWHTTREFEEHIKAIRAMVEDDLFRVAGDVCKKFVWEIKQWRVDERTGNQLDENNHAMSNFRYAVANIKKIRRRAMGTGFGPSARALPRAVVQIRRPRQNAGPVAFRGTSQNEFDRWRASLGGPATRER
jgi:hypothetical protein